MREPPLSDRIQFIRMQNKFSLKFLRLILLLLMTSFFLPSYAVNAKPGIIQCKQPDGSRIEIILTGDGLNKKAFTTDGYELTYDKEGFYVIADIDDNGSPIATEIKDLDPKLRSPQTSLRLNQIDKEAVSQAFSSLKKVNTQVSTRGTGLFNDNYPRTGKQKGIVILVEFPDMKFSIDDPNLYYHRFMNEEGFSDDGATGSARDYFIYNSSGKFEPEFDVYGPVELTHEYSYYGRNTLSGEDALAHEMIIEACLLLDEEVDFADYDRDNDSNIDMVYVIYAGYGEADGGGSDTIWPHSWQMSEIIWQKPLIDDVFLETYACSNEKRFYDDMTDGVGTFIHEFSHVLGLPDLYSTDGSLLPFTPGYWSVLDVGNYNNNSRSPANYSSFERYALDWLQPTELDQEGIWQLSPLTESNQAYLMKVEGKNNEFFLFENRQFIGNDAYLPNHGMLVWHIDYKKKIWKNNEVNNNSDHQHVDIIEADNILSYYTDAGDCFPGEESVTILSPETHPAYKTWKGELPAYSLMDITEEDQLISFRTVDSALANIDKIAECQRIIIRGNLLSYPTGELHIYNISGKKIAIAGNTVILLKPGIYIGKDPDNGSVYKFAIR